VTSFFRFDCLPGGGRICHSTGVVSLLILSAEVGQSSFYGHSFMNS
jgi:hypothetical protein